MPKFWNLSPIITENCLKHTEITENCQKSPNLRNFSSGQELIYSLFPPFSKSLIPRVGRLWPEYLPVHIFQEPDISEIIWFFWNAKCNMLNIFITTKILLGTHAPFLFQSLGIVFIWGHFLPQNIKKSLYFENWVMYVITIFHLRTTSRFRQGISK